MFERPHHQRIAVVLGHINAELMLKHHSLFGGGTAIAMSKGEYRESVDIDFICDSVDGYRELRGLVHEQGVAGLLKSALPLAREPRVDQYGIRCAFLVDKLPIKFEIVFEGRVPLANPDPKDQICGVWTLADEDRVATKLMANSDRWADDAVMGRDIIDLAMLTETGWLMPVGVAKAMKAYGPSVLRDVEKAKAHILNREGRLKAFMQKMGMRMPIEDLRLLVGRVRAAEL